MSNDTRSTAVVANDRLFVLRDDLNHEETVAALCAGIEPERVYWLHGSRPSSLGGYLGRYSGTYEHSMGISPNECFLVNIPTRYFKAFSP